MAGPSYFQTLGFREDRERLFRKLDALTSAIDRVATALVEKNEPLIPDEQPVIEEEAPCVGCEFEQQNPHEWYCTTHRVLVVASQEEPVACHIIDA